MEVVLASSPVDAGIACWDIRTGAELLRYRSCASAPHGLASVSSRLLASSQTPSSSSSSSSILYWSWDRAQVEVRSFPAEPISPLLSNAEGTYLLGGAKFGSIYLWEVSSGRLLKKWQAHYRSVTCLAFSDDESFLISGSEDGSVRVWNLIMLFEEESERTRRPMLHSFTEHSLCVTDVACGYGMSNAIVISSSEDRTCKVVEAPQPNMITSCHMTCSELESDGTVALKKVLFCYDQIMENDVYRVPPKIWSLSKGKLLRSVTFPSVINAIAMDPGENAFYAGGGDGRIYVAALNAQCFSSSSLGNYIISSMFDQSKSITCMSLSKDGVTLVFGSEDGTVRAWDTRSQHVVRVFKHTKGPVNNVVIVRHPLSSNSHGQPKKKASSGRKHVHLPIPPPLEKYYSMDEGFETKPATAVQSSWDGQSCAEYCSYHVMKKQIEELQQQSSFGATEMELERLRSECQQIKGMTLEWKNMYHNLHKLFVNEILDGGDQLASEAI